MSIPKHIENKITEEANWRSTNGHGGVDDITRDNFILAASWGYKLSASEIERLKGLIETAYSSAYNRGFMDCRDKVTNDANPFDQFKKDNNL